MIKFFTHFKRSCAVGCDFITNFMLFLHHVYFSVVFLVLNILLAIKMHCMEPYSVELVSHCNYDAVNALSNRFLAMDLSRKSNSQSWTMLFLPARQRCFGHPSGRPRSTNNLLKSNPVNVSVQQSQVPYYTSVMTSQGLIFKELRHLI